MQAQTLRALWYDEGGQGLVEYALIIALVSIVALAALKLLGGRTSCSLTNYASQIVNAG